MSRVKKKASKFWKKHTNIKVKTPANQPNIIFLCWMKNACWLTQMMKNLSVEKTFISLICSFAVCLWWSRKHFPLTGESSLLDIISDCIAFTELLKWLQHIKIKKWFHFLISNVTIINIPFLFRTFKRSNSRILLYVGWKTTKPTQKVKKFEIQPEHFFDLAIFYSKFWGDANQSNTSSNITSLKNILNKDIRLKFSAKLRII